MKKAIGLVFLMFALVGLPAAVSAQDAPTIRLGFVDLQRALNEVEDGQSARRRLERDFERRQSELNEKQEEVQAFAQELEASYQMLTEEARMERLQEYQLKLAELQEAFVAHQRELAEAEMEATSGIFEGMIEVITEISTERQLTMVFEKTESSILFADASLEFTDELITRYNAR